MRFKATVSIVAPPRTRRPFLNTISTMQAGCWEIVVGARSATSTNDGPGSLGELTGAHRS